MSKIQYSEENIRSLDWKEHIRMRPGMYIGKLGDGSSPDDGIYILLKEVLDNSIDEFVMGSGKTIEIMISDGKVAVRDYGRGIPLGKVIDVVSKMNTGGKYDTRAFKKSVGLNGVGTKAVNALSSDFQVESIRDGELKKVSFDISRTFGMYPPPPASSCTIPVTAATDCLFLPIFVFLEYCRSFKCFATLLIWLIHTSLSVAVFEAKYIFSFLLSTRNTKYAGSSGHWFESSCIA